MLNLVLSSDESRRNIFIFLPHLQYVMMMPCIFKACAVFKTFRDCILKLAISFVYVKRKFTYKCTDIYKSSNEVHGIKTS